MYFVDFSSSYNSKTKRENGLKIYWLKYLNMNDWKVLKLYSIAFNFPEILFSRFLSGVKEPSYRESCKSNICIPININFEMWCLVKIYSGYSVWVKFEKREMAGDIYISASLPGQWVFLKFINYCFGPFHNSLW